MMKILSRYVFSAAAVAVILLIINFTALAAWLLQTGSEVTRGYSISQMADELNHFQEEYLFPEEVQKQLNQNRQWAMLINDNGTVIWSHHLPGDLPLQYSLSDVAGFSRWYLLDYPVHVWEHEDGLFVLGNQKYSVWKQSIEVPERVMDNSRFWLPLFLILNAVTAVFLALLLGFRLFRSLKKLSGGIEDMKQKRPAALPVHGVLGDLAVGINQASAELARQEAALSKRDNARTTWIAGVSHDIRTPLSIAMGYASRLEEDQGVPADGRALAGIIRGQCERIKTLVSDLNLASKLEYDMQPLRRELIELAPLLRSVAADALNSGIEDRYTLTVSVEEQTQNSVVSADRELMKRALSNLINNSMLHNPNGCTIEISLKKKSPFYLFSVTDNGIGFKTEILNRLNDPKEPAEIKNHGLGLIIVRQIIKAHEGSITFQNLSEGGCRVVCYLPDEIW
ncbi:MAG: HAMP domain-containing sensor histidine kinase [Lachnospiraceae bacterium]